MTISKRETFKKGDTVILLPSAFPFLIGQSKNLRCRFVLCVIKHTSKIRPGQTNKNHGKYIYDWRRTSVSSVVLKSTRMVLIEKTNKIFDVPKIEVIEETI
jgi:hypothetical protein